MVGQNNTETLGRQGTGAVCTFLGAPSKEVGICAGMSTKQPRGVLDAFGKVNRGDYVCYKAVWVLDPGPNEKLTKEWQCQ